MTKLLGPIMELRQGSVQLEYKVQVEKVKTLQVLSCDLAPKSNYPGNIEQVTFSKTASP